MATDNDNMVKVKFAPNSPPEAFDLQKYNGKGGDGLIFFRKIGNEEKVVKLFFADVAGGNFRIDYDKVKRFGIEKKVPLLSHFDHKGIINPENLVYDEQDKVIGFSMSKAEGEDLATFFASSEWEKKKFTQKDACKIVDQMIEIMQSAHKQGALLIDPNGGAFLVDKNYNVSVIDVDSWQIDGFKATSVDKKIEDHSAPGQFNENTDWYSLACTSFELFTGVNPYEGKFEGFKTSKDWQKDPQYIALKGAAAKREFLATKELETFAERVQKGASVLSNGVKLKEDCHRSFKDTIPPHMLEYFKEVFENGYRGAIPLSTDVTWTRKRAEEESAAKQAVQEPTPAEPPVVAVENSANQAIDPAANDAQIPIVTPVPVVDVSTEGDKGESNPQPDTDKKDPAPKPTTTQTTTTQTTSTTNTPDKSDRNWTEGLISAAAFIGIGGVGLHQHNKNKQEAESNPDKPKESNMLFTGAITVALATAAVGIWDGLFNGGKIIQKVIGRG